MAEQYPRTSQFDDIHRLAFGTEITVSTYTADRKRRIKGLYFTDILFHISQMKEKVGILTMPLHNLKKKKKILMGIRNNNNPSGIHTGHFLSKPIASGR